MKHVLNRIFDDFFLHRVDCSPYLTMRLNVRLNLVIFILDAIRLLSEISM